ncbi:Uu.00g005410.m01.CDS01 [Anthostomella pinea]|uniref:Uu.00g005410.m01.CDS01 n=1 Tax=Anthostomella pinea TaxID=933095 RepID=A0AAI8VK51_9PEZI|nr:Uu.00g005410.m01.CDS01 [Anthostomella pinea]
MLLWRRTTLFASASWALSQVPLQPQDHSQGYQFDELLHLPGISPYFDAVGFGLNNATPEGCNVTAASYLIRHAAIYANDDDYEVYIEPFLEKLENHRSGWTGPLEFLNKWHSPIPTDKLEEITPSGAGDAYKVGKHLLARYPDLVPTTQKILADKKSRTYDTAKAFVRAFPHADEIEVVRILHDHNGSMDSLIPHKSCPAFTKEPGKDEMATFVSNYAPKVAARLGALVPVKLSDNDIVGMQQLCGYASAIDGKRSPLCGVFTDAKMDGLRIRLGSSLRSHGTPWLAAQSALFFSFDGEQQRSKSAQEGWPADQRLFLSFTHREVPPFVATALGLFNSSSNSAEEFPLNRINWTRAWKRGDGEIEL